MILNYFENSGSTRSRAYDWEFCSSGYYHFWRSDTFGFDHFFIHKGSTYL